MHLSVAVTLIVAAAATLPVAFSAPVEGGSGVAERSFDEELLARGPNLSVIPKQSPPKPWPQPKGKRAIPKQSPPKPWPRPKGKRADFELEDLFAREDFEELLARGPGMSTLPEPPKVKTGKRADFDELFAREFLLD